jgi:predicted nuclease with TOPRIM domain
LSVSISDVEQGTVNWNDDRLDHFAEQVDKRFEHVDERFDRFEEQVNRRFERVDERFDKFESHVEARFDHLDARFEKRFDSLQNSMIISLAGILAAFAALFATAHF